MRFSGPFFFLLSAVLVVLAGATTKYFELGTKLTLEKDIPTVPQPINYISWKHGSDLVVSWTPSVPEYYGSFIGRTTLDPKTLQLDINNLTFNDRGRFSLDTNSGPSGTYDVEVIKPPPTPSIKTQPMVCDVSCTLKCTANTTDLGPVSYEWKEDEGPWTEGVELKVMESSNTSEKFSCRLKTHVRTSEASTPEDNPLYKPVKVTGLTGWDIFGIIFGILILAVIAVIALVKWRPSNPLSMLIRENEFLKKYIFGNQQPVPQSDPEQPAEPAANSDQLSDQGRPANGVQASEDSEMQTLNTTPSGDGIDADQESIRPPSESLKSA